MENIKLTVKLSNISLDTLVSTATYNLKTYLTQLHARAAQLEAADYLPRNKYFELLQVQTEITLITNGGIYKNFRHYRPEESLTETQLDALKTFYYTS